MATFTWYPPEPAPAADPTGSAVPLRVAVKDLLDMAGVVTTSGSRVLAGITPPAESDAACLAGIRAAEAAGDVVVVGRTNLHELAFGVTGVNPWFGTPVNPIDGGRVPGGSSSGSAVAVAAGEADVAIGTDTGGSVRIPAACCGVVGLKTTRGRIPLAGVKPLAPSLDTVGPMGGTVAATARLMELLDPGFDPARGRPAARVGRLRLPALPEIDAALDRALDAYVDRTGATLDDVDLPGWAEATHAAMIVLSAEAWQVHADLWRDHAAELSPDVAERLELSSLIGPEEVAAAWGTAHDWVRELAAVFATVDVIAMPVIAEQPPLIADGRRLTEIRYVAPWNLAGLPAIALPVATAGGGPWPPSLQLAGPARAEEVLVATAAVVEAAAGGTPAPGRSGA